MTQLEAVADRRMPHVRATDAPGITVTAWSPRMPPREISLFEARDVDGVVCFMVDWKLDPEDAYRALRPLCGPDLQPQMIEDLLSPDDLPRVNEYGGGTVRKVSAFGAFAEPAEDGASAGRLVFDLVEFLANKRWMIVCCHAASSFAGAEGCTVARARARASLLAAAQARWIKGRYSTAPELGIIMLHQLTCTYSKARRALLAWLERWELGWYRGDSADHEMLVNLRGLAAEFRARLNALNQPRDEAADNWFGEMEDDSIAQRADRNIDRALEALDRLSDMLRSSFELLHTQSTAEQLRLQRMQADRTERLQAKIEKITSIFLVPSLVAAFFGANTALPGGNDTNSWMSFEIMVVTMVVGALVAYHGLAWFREHEHRQLEGAEDLRLPGGEVGGGS